MRRAVTDSIGAVEDAFLTDMFYQLADDAGGAVGIARVLAPGELADI